MVLSTGAGKEATSLTVTGNKIDPSKVTAADIVGGVDSSTGKETGLEVVRQVYPKLSMTPGILLAPRFSKDATVAAALLGCRSPLRRPHSDKISHKLGLAAHEKPFSNTL